LSGIQRGIQGLNTEVHAIATAVGTASEPADLAGAMVRSLVYTRSIEANAAVIRRADDALGSLIDALA
jgi:hypothetical protein